MRGAGRISAAYSKLEEQTKQNEERQAAIKEIKEREKRRLSEVNSISQHDDQMSITNDRKNILEKISK